MPGKNRNSRDGTWTDVVRPETKAKAVRSRELLESGNSLRSIAKILRLSESRVRELLK